MAMTPHFGVPVGGEHVELSSQLTRLRSLKTGSHRGRESRVGICMRRPPSIGSPIPDVAVYLSYSIADGQNDLRGIQVADRAERVTFDPIFPGCYGGR